MSRRRALTGIIAIGIVCAAGYAWHGRPSPVASVPTVPVERGQLKLTVRASGAVDWALRMPVHMPMSGRLDELLVTEGQRVGQGERVAQMSAPQRAILRDLDLPEPPQPGVEWESIYRPIPILAPRTGTVMDVAAAAGQNLVVHQPLFWIADRPVARVLVEEGDLRQIIMGSEATLSFYALPDLTITAVVTRVNTRIHPQRAMVAHEVDLALDPMPEPVRAGMSVSILLEGPAREDTLLVPNTAITLREGRVGVRLALPDGTDRFQPVTTGLSDGATTEVLDGVREGDPIWVDADWVPAAPPRRRESAHVPLIPYARRAKP